MKTSKLPFILLLILPAVFFAWFFISARNDKPIRSLPYYGPKGDASGKKHVVPAFRFTDQDGREFSQKDLQGKIYVTEFFFTTCQSICPVMNWNMSLLYELFRAEPRLHFLSHTVDPGTDSVHTLKQYAESLGVSDGRWSFVTGDKTALYSMARQGYLLDNSKADPHDDFVHTQKFALVDSRRHLRGFYDGTDSLEINRLRQDIYQLLKEDEGFE